jgi:hypothetical protein
VKVEWPHLVIPEDHKHWVTVIETRDPANYDGPRTVVFHTLEEAEEHILDWLNEEMEACFETANMAMREYNNTSNKWAAIHEH